MNLTDFITPAEKAFVHRIIHVRDEFDTLHNEMKTAYETDTGFSWGTVGRGVRNISPAKIRAYGTEGHCKRVKELADMASTRIAKFTPGFWVYDKYINVETLLQLAEENNRLISNFCRKRR